MYVMDTEADGLLDEATGFHCLVFKVLNKNKFYVFCDLNNLSNEHRKKFEDDGCQFFPLNDYVKLIRSKNTKGLICHNIFGYDLRAMELWNGIKYTGKTIEGRDIFLCDTLVLSRGLNPERRMPKGCPTSVKNTETGKMDKIGPHGLESWGWRVGIHKPIVHDWSSQPLDVYVDRCVEDTKINELVFHAQMNNMNNVAISNGKKKGDWKVPMRMQTEVYRLMCDQEQTGVCFDIEAAEKLLIEVDKEMADIERRVEPGLGRRELPAGKQPKPPRNPWKKPFNFKQVWTVGGKLRKPVIHYLTLIGYTDEAAREKFISKMTCEEDFEKCITKHPSLLSSHAINYCLKFDITDPNEQMEEIERLEKGGTPKKLTEKLRLKHKKDVKEFLMKNGWKPTIWKNRNIIINPKTKQSLTDEEINVKLGKYLKEFVDSIYWEYIYKDLGYKRKPDHTTTSFIQKCLRNGRQLMSAPQYKDQRGVRCTNLKSMADENSKLIIRWLSLQNRRNTIKSMDETKETGWLHHPRLKVDGRLPARSSGITPTYRQKHSVVVNVPKPKDHVVLGKEMRRLFIAPPGYWNIGCDASGIEQRVAGHYASIFDGGVYAAELLEGDTHTKNALAYSEAADRDINRDDGKNLTYAIMYGAQAKKIALMASVDQEVGQFLIDAFWDNNPGLKEAKEALIDYWESANKQYVMGIDGRKIITRSKHSIMNALFQSTGALIMDFAGCWCAAQIAKRGLDAERWGYIHDEYQWYHSKKEVLTETFNATPEQDLPFNKKGKQDRDDDPLKPEQERNGKLWSVPKFDGVVWRQQYSQVGELIARGMEAAGRHFEMNLPFPGEYMVGSNWAECH